MNTTTIRLKKETKEKLRQFEIHPRETSEDIVLRLIKKCEESKNESDKIH